MKFLTREEVLERIASNNHVEDIYVLAKQTPLDKRNDTIKFFKIIAETIDILSDKEARVFIDFYEEEIEELPVPPAVEEWKPISDGIYPEPLEVVWVRLEVKNEDGSGIIKDLRAIYDGDVFRDELTYEKLDNVVAWAK